MSKIKTIIICCLVMVLAGGVFASRNDQNLAVNMQEFEALQKEFKALQKKVNTHEAQKIADKKLGQYAINMMYRTGANTKLSSAKQLILARAIVRVANEIFEHEEHKHAFVTALAIESRFERFAQSPTGPKGYAQLAKGSFHEAMKLCGFGDAKSEDVWETDLNLYAGACYFRMILEMPEVNQDAFIAIVGYNQGPYSGDFKAYAKNGQLEGIEPLKYIAKFAFLKRTVTDEAGTHAPAIQDLPKPGLKDLKDKSKNATVPEKK